MSVPPLKSIPRFNPLRIKKRILPIIKKKKKMKLFKLGLEIIFYFHNTNVLSLFLKIIIDVKCLEIKYDANKVVISPIDNVIAKPFIGPEPNKNKIIEAINVVILASNIVTIIFKS